MPPSLHLPLPPQTPPACSRQERTELSKRQRSARTRGSHAGQANLGLPPQDCIVGIASALHSVVMQQLKLRQGCKHALVQQQCSSRNDMHRHAQTHSHNLAHTHTHTDTHTRSHARKHARTPAHTHTHSSYGTQAARKASTCTPQ